MHACMYACMHVRRKEGRERFWEICVHSQQFHLCRVFSQPHIFFVSLQTLMKSFSSFPPTSVILNKKLPYHHMDIVLESLQGPCKLWILMHTFTAKTETMSRDLP